MSITNDLIASAFSHISKTEEAPETSRVDVDLSKVIGAVSGGTALIDAEGDPEENLTKLDDALADIEKFLNTVECDDEGHFVMVEGEVDADVAKYAVETVEKVMKTEDGKEFPSSAYAYVGDAEKVTTWKLRLFDDPADVPSDPSVTLTAAAAQALSPSGFRGNQVELPSDAVAATKRKVAAAWKKARAGTDAADNLPDVLKADDDSDESQEDGVEKKSLDEDGWPADMAPSERPFLLSERLSKGELERRDKRHRPLRKRVDFQRGPRVMR